MKNAILLMTLFICINYAIAVNVTTPKNSQFGFIENKGQIIDQNNNLNPAVLYLYNGNGMHVQLKQTGFSYEVIKTESLPTRQAGKSKMKAGNEINLSNKFAQDTLDYTFYFHRIDISFVNANTDVKIISSGVASDFINYYTIGTSEAGVTNVRHYKKVLYENIYNNIDVEFVLVDENICGSFKYNFIVHPGGNVNDIKLKFDGANSTSLTKEGHITIETAYGNIDESIPKSYQLNEKGDQQTITSAFITHNSKLNIYGIGVSNYDANKTLIIDPWATYYGGSGDDYGLGIAVDVSGNNVITGYTYSTSGIATSGAYQTSYGGTNDAFIAKFNIAGALQWATYYGGSAADIGLGIAIDGSGNIVLSGSAASTSGIATTGAYQTSYAGGSNDVFIAKFNASGARQWATYYGGSGFDYGIGIAIDRTGNIVLTGYTYSTSGIATSGAYLTTLQGSYDAYIAKFNAAGLIQWATYYGGSGDDEGDGIAVDSSGNIIISGSTTSTFGIATSGMYQTSLGGGSDAFISKFNASGVRQWATYYGGNGADYGYGITVDGSGNIVFTGSTSSTSGIATTGAYQTSFGGTKDAFISKFNASGARQWATYYGGSLEDNGYAIAADSIGIIVITGNTISTSGIATSGAYQTVYGGGNFDAFIAKFNTSGARQWATYYGGSGRDWGSGIAVDGSGNIRLVGYTYSTSNIAMSGSYQTSLGGTVDACVALFTSAGNLPVKLISFDAKLDNLTTGLINKKVICSWLTASETNNNYFELQRSVDGSHFTTIGNIKGNGTKNSESYYQYTDNLMSIEKSTTNILYYRLNQVDFDGKSSLSEIKIVKLEEVNNEINVYPNPTNNVLNISFTPQSSSVVMNLYDITGNIIKNVTTLNSNNQIDLSELNNGIYFIIVTGNNLFLSRKFVVKK